MTKNNTKELRKKFNDRAVMNLSYDKSLPISERLRDFLGAYHLVLHGVNAHEPFSLVNEGQPNKMCDTEDKNSLIEFVTKIFESSLLQQRKEMVEEFGKLRKELSYSYYEMSEEIDIEKLLNKIDNILNTLEKEV